MLKVFTELFEFNCSDFLEQFRISRKRLGLDDLVLYQMRHSGVSVDLNTKFLSVAATSVHGTLRETREFKPMPVDTSAPHCNSPNCVRPLRGRHVESRQERSLLPVRMKGQYALQVFVGGHGMGRARGLLGFTARSWELDRCLASQADTRRCLRRLFKEVTAGSVCSVCLRRCSVFASAHVHSC